jgi:hypothetical protein
MGTKIKRNKSITIDLNKKGCDEVYDFIKKESKHHNNKLAPAVIELIYEALRYRRLNSNEVTLIDSDKNVIAKLKK